MTVVSWSGSGKAALRWDAVEMSSSPANRSTRIVPSVSAVMLKSPWVPLQTTLLTVAVWALTLVTATDWLDGPCVPATSPTLPNAKGSGENPSVTTDVEVRDGRSRACVAVARSSGFDGGVIGGFAVVASAALFAATDRAIADDVDRVRMQAAESHRWAGGAVDAFNLSSTHLQRFIAARRRELDALESFRGSVQPLTEAAASPTPLAAIRRQEDVATGNPLALGNVSSTDELPALGDQLTGI